MKIILYNNYSENNNMNKIIVDIIEMTGELREPSSLINPVILIEYDPSNPLVHFNGNVVDDNNVKINYNNKKVIWSDYFYNKVLTSNYVYIPEFNRYYFINDITSVRQNLWRLSLHVDVLMSYKNEIGDTNAFVTRNQNTYDPMVKDDEMSYYYDKEVIEINADKGDLVNEFFETDLNVTDLNHNVIINVINDQIDPYEYRTEIDDSGLPVVSTAVTGSNATSMTYAFDVTQLKKLSDWVLDTSELNEYINSIIIYPFNVNVATPYATRKPLRLGGITLQPQGFGPYNHSSVLVYKMKTISPYLVVADFTITGESFKDYEPYTTYEIYLPYLSWISISADMLLNNRIIVYYVIDYPSGKAQATIYDYTNQKVIYTTDTQLGVKVALTTTNRHQLDVQETSNNTSLGIGLATSLLAVLGGVISSNPLMIGGGVMGAIGTGVKYTNNQNQMILHTTGQITSGHNGLYLPQDVKIRKTIMKPKGYDDDYFKLKGRPLNKVVKLNSLSGFTIVGDEHLENFGSATKQEIEEIKSLLSTGVIL